MAKKANPDYLDEVENLLKSKPTDLSLVTSLVMALSKDTTKRLGRIERNQIAFEQAACAANPEFLKALIALRAANMKTKDPA